MTDVLKQYQGDAITVGFNGTQGLDSAAIDEWVDASDEIINSGGYPFCDIEIVLGSAAFTGADSAAEVYFIPRVDGTNYADYSGGGTATDEQENNQLFIGAATTSAATAAQRLAIRDVELPAGAFKVGFRNKTGVAMAASGNSVKLRYWAWKSV